MITVADQVSAVTGALREQDALGADEHVVSVTQLAGGWSRHTHLVVTSQRRLVVRARPQGALLDTDLGLEYRVYVALRDTDVRTPDVYAYVPSADTPFGGPFMVMEYIEGTAPNMYDRDDQRRLADDFAGDRVIAQDMLANLAAIHALASDRLPTGLPALDFAAVVSRWQTVYETRRLIRDPVIEEAFAWVRERAPAQAWPGLVHGDYRIGNVLVHDGRVRAILDWELCYQGDVRFDLGYQAIPRAAGKHLRARSPLLAIYADRAWFLDRYSELTGRTVTEEDLATFAMLGIMMLLATQLTATWMYAHGHTTDVRMAWSRFSFAGLRQDMIELMGW